MSYAQPRIDDMEWEPTLLPTDRQSALRAACGAAAHVPGAAAELGVYRGGSAHIIADCLPRRDLHLFDTFAGLPNEAHTAGDVLEPGTFWATSQEHVLARLHGHNAILHCGLFPDSAAGLEDLRFALVHIDADYHQSTRDGLQWFWPRMVVGGLVVVDDFEFPDTPGTTRAVREFMRDETGWAFGRAATHQIVFVRKCDTDGCSSR